VNRPASVLFLAFAVGCGQASTPLDFPEPVDAGQGTGDGAAEAETTTCEPLTCKHLYLQRCGHLTNACGVGI
jgi:hypothetical protein